MILEEVNGVNGFDTECLAFSALMAVPRWFGKVVWEVTGRD